MIFNQWGMACWFIVYSGGKYKELLIKSSSFDYFGKLIRKNKFVHLKITSTNMEIFFIVTLKSKQRSIKTNFFN